MKNFIILAAFLVTTSFCKSQTSELLVTGNFIGQSTVDRSVSSIEVMADKKFVLQTFDLDRKLQKEFKGEWLLDGNKLLLKEESGTITVLEKYKDLWYISSKNGYFCLARFYQNKNQDEFWKQIRTAGC